MKTKFYTLGVVLAFGSVVLSGCTNNDKTDTPAEKAGVAVKEAAGNATKATEDTVKTAGRVTTDTAKKVEDKTDEAVKNTGKAIDNADLTGKVKTALMSAKDLDTSKINVDTSSDTVMLKGTVATQAQKDSAGTIAKNIAGSGYKVDNQLVIGK